MRKSHRTHTWAARRWAARARIARRQGIQRSQHWDLPLDAAGMDPITVAVLQTMQEGFCVVGQDGRILACNEALCRMLGYSHAELCALRVSDVERIDDDALVAARLQHIASAGYVRFQTQHYRKDGRLIDVEVSATHTRVLPDLFFVFVHDISAARQAELRLKQSEEMLHYIVKHDPGDIVIFDTDLNVLMVSDQCLKDYRISAEQVVGKPISQTLPHIPQKSLDVLKRCLEGVAESGETEFVQADGSPSFYKWHCRPWYRAGGQIGGVVSYSENITERKLAELRLRENQAVNRGLFETANEGILVYDCDLNTVYANRRICEMLGYSDAELIRIPFPGLLLPEDLPSHWEIMAARRQGQGGRYERRLVRKDGAVIWTLISSSPRFSAEGEFDGGVSMLTDITERKRSEETVLRFKTIFDLADFGAIIVTLDGFITYINACFAPIHGYQPGELLGQHLSTFYSPEQLNRLLAKYDELFAKGRLTGFEIMHRRRDGVEFPMSLNGLILKDETGAPAFVATTAVDLTVQKRAEHEMLEIQRNLLEAQRIARLGSYWLDMRTFDTAWSEGMYSLIERDPAMGPISPFAFLNMVHPDDVQVILDATRDITIDKAYQEYGYRVLLEDGSVRYFISRVQPELDENGQVTRAIGVIQDITELKEAENCISELNEALEQRVIERTAQLMAANQELEAFSYSVSHDLRAPLRGIDGWSYALLEDYGEQLDQQGQEYIRRVRSEAQRMGRLIEDLLKLSRLSRAELFREQIDLSALARQIADRLLESEPGRQARFEIQPGLTAYGDAHLLEAARSNLIGNAFKFTGKTPNACIQIGHTETPGGAAPVSGPAYYVRDNGAGFNMEYAGKLFGAFQRMHHASEFPGTGVGLATVQRIIHRHGGQVWAEAAVNQGATFYFTLEDAQ